MKVTLAGTTYVFETMEIGGNFEDKTGFLRLKSAAGVTVADWKFLDSLEGFIFSAETLQPLTGATLSATAVVETAISVTPSFPTTADQAPTYAYQWQISTDGSTWADIEDATEATYTPVTGNGTKYIRVKVTAYGSVIGEVYSGKSAAVAQALKSATLSATPKVGTAITVTLAYSATPTGPTLAYKWQISANGTSGWADISGATSATYTPVAGDATKFVRVIVTATGTAIGTATSAASTAIAAA